MIKTNQFNEKAQYVSPSCKSVVLEASASFMTPGSPNAQGLFNLEGDDVVSQSEDWGF